MSITVGKFEHSKRQSLSVVMLDCAQYDGVSYIKATMPKVRVRTTEKASWSSDSPEKAIQLIDGGSSIKNAAKVMGIPFSSLQKGVKKGSALGPHLSLVLRQKPS
ncbi:hypothetical protein JTB14_008622 [Gonioctena quinquepunctata]|nr:hypothetical protein JTB14_008622 [Gonioctena quinquepunctata]